MVQQNSIQIALEDHSLLARSAPGDTVKVPFWPSSLPHLAYRRLAVYNDFLVRA